MVDVCLYVIGHLGMGPQFLYGIVPPCVGCFTRQDIVLPDGGINDSLIQFEYLCLLTTTIICVLCILDSRRSITRMYVVSMCRS